MARDLSPIRHHRGIPYVAGTNIPADLVIGGFHAGVSFRALAKVWPTVPIEVFEAVVRWHMRGRGRRIPVRVVPAKGGILS